MSRWRPGCETSIFTKPNLVEAIDGLGGYDVEVFRAPGTNWTIAGIVASQSLIQLRTYFLNSFRIEVGLLAWSNLSWRYIEIARLWEQYFLGGSDIKFTGKDKFLQGSWFQHVAGSEELKHPGLDSKLFTGWGGGIHDDTFAGIRRKIIKERRLLNQPYNLTLLTVDTHSPNGYPSPMSGSK